MCLATVDCKLPKAVLDADILNGIVKDTGDIEVVEPGYGNVGLKSGVRKYFLNGNDTTSYPYPPNMPEKMHEAPNWGQVLKVVHAAAPEADKAVSNLAVVHFTPDYVEATDKARFARVDIEGQWVGLVPVKLFKTWPKKKGVSVVFTKSHGFFQIGPDEVRIAVLQATKYPDTASVIPKSHRGPLAIVNVEETTKAVSQATNLASLGLVSLDGVANGLQVTAWEPDDDVDVAMQAVVPILHAKQGLGRALVSGKYLKQLLKQVDSVNVILGFGEVSDPLRVEAGNFIGLLWQQIMEKKV